MAQQHLTVRRSHFLKPGNTANSFSTACVENNNHTSGIEHKTTEGTEKACFNQSVVPPLSPNCDSNSLSFSLAYSTSSAKFDKDVIALYAVSLTPERTLSKSVFSKIGAALRSKPDSHKVLSFIVN